MKPITINTITQAVINHGDGGLQTPAQPAGNFRGQFHTDHDGNYRFETVVPSGYNVPADGPCGEVLRLLGRHTWRAAHIHFKLSATGYLPLTTQVFIEGAPQLDSDTTFAVRTNILKLQKHESLAELQAQNQNKPFYSAQFDFVLKPVEAAIARVENAVLSL